MDLNSFVECWFCLFQQFSPAFCIVFKTLNMGCFSAVRFSWRSESFIIASVPKSLDRPNLERREARVGRGAEVEGLNHGPVMYAPNNVKKWCQFISCLRVRHQIRVGLGL